MIYEDGVKFYELRINELFLYMNKLFKKIDDFTGVCDNEEITFTHTESVYPVEI